MDTQPTEPRRGATSDDMPVGQSGAPRPKQSEPPDQKTIDALLLLTRTEHEERYRQKAGNMDNVPKGMVAGYIGRKAHAFSPAVLTSSAGARWSAVLLAIILIVSLVLAFAL